ncbi:DUF4123 domain-containing protein [Lonsdalea quercina]|uniref:DUF4123 domain-containing protein n=1 Tax=Lonsdalea quercina TaxID=71657 RepID=UPI003976EBF2
MSFYQQLGKAGLPVDNSRTHLYVLAETSAEKHLLARLEFHEVVHYPLWHLDTQAGLEPYTPWLCVPEPDSDFDLWLGKTFETMPMIVMFTRMPPDAVRQHLKYFSKFVEGSRRFILRLGTPSALQLYIASIAHSPSSVSRFFADGEIEEMYFHDPQASLSRRVQPLFEQQREEEAECDGCLIWLDLAVGQEA